MKNLQNRRNIGGVKLSKSSGDRPPVAKRGFSSVGAAGGSGGGGTKGNDGKRKSGKGFKLAPKVNPFDKFPNAKKKFEVLNLKVQGGERNVGRARQRAIDVRESRLRDDYRVNKKSNSFIDKRFGEADASMSIEDKMAIRFQKEKIRHSKSSSVFNLDAPVEVLTHKGKVLSESTVADSRRRNIDDDEE